MAGFSDALSSVLTKLKLRPRLGGSPGENPPEQKIESPPGQENNAVLGNLGDSELAEFMSRHLDREAIRVLQTITDQDLQSRMVQALSHEPTLKRIARSQFDKKLKRVAEKRLRETGSAAAEQRLQKVIRLSEKIQTFVDHPQWSDAEDLLRLALDQETDGTNPVVNHFQALRARLIAAVEGYNKTYSEMEEICNQLETSSGPVSPRLRNRWSELEEMYSFPENCAVIARYGEILKLRASAQQRSSQSSPQAPSGPTEDAQLKAKEQQRLQAQKSKEQKIQKERERRLQAMDDLLSGLRELSENLTHAHAGARLRNLQNDVTALRRWKTEYPLKMEEAETLLKALLSKRTEVIHEAKWDAWARTDRAARIQAELEAIIRGFEDEQDSEAALSRAAGLTQRLFDYSKEMRELGALEREKDQEIWDQFKALSERGRMVCGKVGVLTQERLRSELSEHASKPIEFTAEFVMKSSGTVHFKTSAFADDVSLRMEKLQALWREFGPRASGADRETEALYKKLLELYFRQRNLHRGQLQRAEANAIHEKRELLREMKIACEGKSSLVARTGVAKKLEEKWKRTPLPAMVSGLQAEFEAYQIRLNAELAEEIKKQVELAVSIQTQARSMLDKTLDKNEANLPQVLSTIAKLEAELLGLEKQAVQINGLKQAVAGSADTLEAEKTFHEILDQTRELFQEARTAAKTEIAERALRRNQVLTEAEGLAVSTEWEWSGARFEELKTVWKKVGTLGEAQDSFFHALFENVCLCHLSRVENKERTYTSAEKAAALKAREELLCSLEALIRLRPKTGSEGPAAISPLPFVEGENSKAFGKVLEFGLKYKQIVSLDPKSGAIKETKKIMVQWARLPVPDDEYSGRFWRAYLDRVHELFELRV